MKHVFITQDNKKTNIWKVFDKETGKLIEEVDDILLFNAKFKRLGKAKGWHGILSENINAPVIRLLSWGFSEIHHIPKKYYPRIKQVSMDIPYKKTTFLRITDNRTLVRDIDRDLNDYELISYTGEYYDVEV